MSALRESFLLIGPWDARLKDVGARVVASLSEAGPPEEGYGVIGLSVTALLEKKFPAYRDEVRRLNPGLQMIAVIPEGYPVAELIRLHQENGLSKVLSGSTLEEAEPALYEALERASKLRQQIAMERLLREQEQKLETLRSELESRVEKRTRLLAESRHNLHVRNSRLEGLRRALLAVQESESFEEMEKALNASLAGTVETSWIRIVPAPRHEEFAAEIRAMEGFAWHSVPLWRGAETIGAAFFMRPTNMPFRREDLDFLGKVSEAVSLAMDRQQKRAEAETLKEQWEATFSAINEPVAIIDRAYDVIQINSAEPTGGRCYERLFGRTEPCPGCRRGELFRMENDGRVWEVHSQLLPLEPGREPMFVNLYSDVTERIRMEQRIVESARMAELGTIGSSIAHELNNPLGGILNFAQLLRMDLPADHPIADDVKEIEDGARRCKEIVENLLGFTRAPRSDEITAFDLREAVRRAIGITELRAHSTGVDVVADFPAQPCDVRGHFNLVAQALAGMLDRALDSILSRRAREAGFRGRIDVAIGQDEREFVVEIRDDGTGESSSARLGLTLQISSQIFRDNGARLEMKGPSSPVSAAKISFSRPVLRS